MEIIVFYIEKNQERFAAVNVLCHDEKNYEKNVYHPFNYRPLEGTRAEKGPA